MNSESGRFIKDPQAKLDYGVNWAAWLDGDVILNSTWSADPGITIEADSATDSVATVWLSGGAVGKSYQVTNHITTQGGREDDFSIMITVLQK